VTPCLCLHVTGFVGFPFLCGIRGRPPRAAGIWKSIFSHCLLARSSLRPSQFVALIASYPDSRKQASHAATISLLEARAISAIDRPAARFSPALASRQLPQHPLGASPPVILGSASLLWFFDSSLQSSLLWLFSEMHLRSTLFC